MSLALSQGKTREEALAKIQEAIRAYTMGAIARDAELTPDEFRRLL